MKNIIFIFAILMFGFNVIGCNTNDQEKQDDPHFSCTLRWFRVPTLILNNPAPVGKVETRKVIASEGICGAR